MRSTAHFFLSMACGGLAEQQLDKGDGEACDSLSREVCEDMLTRSLSLSLSSNDPSPNCQGSNLGFILCGSIATYVPLFNHILCHLLRDFPSFGFNLSPLHLQPLSHALACGEGAQYSFVIVAYQSPSHFELPYNTPSYDCLILKHKHTPFFVCSAHGAFVFKKATQCFVLTPSVLSLSLLARLSTSPHSAAIVSWFSPSAKQ